MKFLSKKYLVIITLTAIGAFTIFLRAPYLSVPALIVDEALYAEIANTILDGGLPYRDAWEQKPPGIYYLYALVFKVFGKNNLFAVHIFGIAAVLLTALGLFSLGCIIHSVSTGIIASFFYGILSSAGSASHFQAANTELFAMMFAVWAVVLYIRWNKQAAAMYCTGVLAAMGFLFKQPAGLVGMVIIGHLFLMQYSNWRNCIVKTLWFFAGFASVIAGVAGYFLFRGALYDLWMVGFWHNILYMKGNSLLYGLRVAVKNIPVQTNGNFFFYITAATVFLFAVRHLLQENSTRSITDKLRNWLFVLWWCIGWGSVGLGWRFEGHYFFFVLPVVSLLSAYCCVSTVFFLKLKCGIKSCGLLLFFLLICAYGVGNSLYTHCYGAFRFQRTYNVLMDADNQQGESFRRTAQYIQANTTANQRIFVWGFAPEIYTLSDRRCASRFIFCNFLIGQMTGDEFFFKNIERLDRTIPGAWNHLMKDLMTTFPQFVVDTSPSNYFQYGNYPITRFAELRSFINSFYQFDRRIGNMDVYRLDETRTH